MSNTLLKSELSAYGNYQYDHHSFYLLRIPYFSVDYLKELYTLYNIENSEPTLFTKPDFLEALFLGSFELYQEYIKYLSTPKTSKEKIPQKLLNSIEKYFIRMCSRCTPYGLFAGYKLGLWGDSTSISLQSRSSYKKHVHLDMNYLANLSIYIQTIPEIKRVLLFFPNNSIYKVGDKLRYIEYLILNGIRNYRLSAIDNSEYVDAILSKAEKGSCIQELIDCIAGEDISLEEAQNFIDSLISCQLLISELEPALTSNDYFKDILTKLSSLPISNSLVTNLHLVFELLQSPEAGVQYYQKINELLTPITPDIAFKNFTRTDLELSVNDIVLNDKVAIEIQANLNTLRPLFRIRQNSHLVKFQKAYKEKYENCEMPLFILLDPEIGIGYEQYSEGIPETQPLLENLSLSEAEPDRGFSWSKLLKWKNKKLKEALFNHKDFIITEEDIENNGFSIDTLKIPENFYIMGNLLAETSSEIDRGNYIFSLDAGFGPGNVSLLSRFYNGDPSFASKLHECIQSEEDLHPDKIYAEIVHLPESNASNVLVRPAFRKYEIPYLGKSSVKNEYQIPIKDLFIRIINDKIVLWSKKLNKEIIPRLTTAHNFLNSNLPIYKFLCDLQIQDCNNVIIWDWDLFSKDTYLPRVVYKNILLHPATWNLSLEDYPIFHEIKTRKTAVINEYIFLVYDDIRKKLKMPSQVIISENDQKLFIDFNDENYVKLFHSLFMKKKQVRIQEFLFTNENCFIEGEGGKYANELIIPFKKSMPPEENENKICFQSGSSFLFDTQRNFTLGSEWLYIKIYTGASSAEAILKSSLRLLIQQLQREKLIEKWFFIRYTDPKFHLRIRFFNSSNLGFWKKTLDYINSIFSEHINSGVIEKIQIDTYKRELERYGKEKIGFSESFFYFDSEACLRILNLIEGDKSEELRWMVSMRNIDILLSDFNYDLEEKYKLSNFLSNEYIKEFNISKNILLNFAALYRNKRKEINSIMNKLEDQNNEIKEMIIVFEERSKKNKILIKDLINTPQKGSGNYLPTLITSYIHMAMNRIFTSDLRKQELALYYLLAKYYEDRLAFLKFNKG